MRTPLWWLSVGDQITEDRAFSGRSSVSGSPGQWGGGPWSRRKHQSINITGFPLFHLTSSCSICSRPFEPTIKALSPEIFPYSFKTWRKWVQRPPSHLQHETGVDVWPQRPSEPPPRPIGAHHSSSLTRISPRSITGMRGGQRGGNGYVPSPCWHEGRHSDRSGCIRRILRASGSHTCLRRFLGVDALWQSGRPLSLAGSQTRSLEPHV